MNNQIQAAEHAASAQSPLLTDCAKLINASDLAEAVGKPNDPPHHLVAEVASRWAVSPASIYRMIDAKELGHLKVRGAIRIPHQVVLDYEAQQLAANTNQVEAA